MDSETLTKGNELRIRIERLGPPIPKGRPRWVPVGDGSRSRMITPKRTREAERDLARIAREALGSDFEPLSGPVIVNVAAIVARPKRLQRKKDPEGLMWRTSRPDADNVRKWVLDSLNRIAFEDDSQVVAGHTFSLYSEKNGLAATVIEIVSGDEILEPESESLSWVAGVAGY